MLIRYFLRCFFLRTLIFFGILTAVFASCNIFMRLPLIYNASTIPLLIWAMLPLVSLFSLPLSSSLAVCTTLMLHITGDELLLLSFLHAARRSLFVALGIFSLTIAIIYGFLIFDLVPHGYRAGKKLLLSVAKEHFNQLAPHKFHAPLPGVTFFFRNKTYHNQAQPLFKELFLAFTPNKDNKEQYFFTAEGGLFKGSTLLLNNGSMYLLKNGGIHRINFQQSKLALQKYISSEQSAAILTHRKFLTLKNILSTYKICTGALIELHKRIAQVVWQLLLPILVFLWGIVLEQRTLVGGIGLCGLLYLLSYIVITFAQTYNMGIMMMFLFYAPLCIVLGLGMYSARKKLL